MAKEKKGYQPETMNYSKQRHNTKGEEVLDPTPMQPPLGYKRAPTLAEQIRQQVVAHKLEALDQLEETEEEADDFNIDDDVEPYSPHENDGMPTVKELRAKVEGIKAAIKKRNLETLRDQLEKEAAAKAAAPAKPEKPLT